MKLRCPHCHAGIKVRSIHGGQIGKCVHCKGKVKIPTWQKYQQSRQANHATKTQAKTKTKTPGQEAQTATPPPPSKLSTPEQPLPTPATLCDLAASGSQTNVLTITCPGCQAALVLQKQHASASMLRCIQCQCEFLNHSHAKSKAARQPDQEQAHLPQVNPADLPQSTLTPSPAEDDENKSNQKKTPIDDATVDKWKQIFGGK